MAPISTGSSLPASSSTASAKDLFIVDYSIHDVRFPTNLTGDGTDAMNKECDYSAAYVILYAGAKGTERTQRVDASGRLTTADDGSLKGYGMTFTIGRGNEICCSAIASLVEYVLLGKSLDSLFSNMGKTWEALVTDCQLRWLGPEKGVIHLASAAAVNAVWDMYARFSQKPLWLLIADMTPEELVRVIPFRYISDAVSPSEAYAIFSAAQKGKQERVAFLKKEGYPAYTTSAGWSGYSDDKVARLTREALAHGFTHFKLKVGANIDDDKRRLALLRSIVDNPAEIPADWVKPTAANVAGKNAGPTGAVVMIDANQVFDVQEAIDYITQLAEYRPWFIEEPTSPDDVLGHATIRKALAPLGVGVATGEHAHSRVMFKQLLQADSIDVVQIDSCRLAGVNEVMAVMLMAKKFGKIVCPHAGGVGLCEYVQHLSLVDYTCISTDIDRNVLEWVDHLHEHFVDPARISAKGRYVAPSVAGYSMEMIPSSIEDYTFPTGSYWAKGEARTPPPKGH